MAKYHCGAGKFKVPAHFTFRAQKPGRGVLLPRTISRSTPHKTPEEKDKLSTGAGQGRKLPSPQYGALNLTGPYSIPCYLIFPTTPNYWDVWIDRMSLYPKSKTDTWTQNGEVNTSIKGKESQGGEGPPKEEKS